MSNQGGVIFWLTQCRLGLSYEVYGVGYKLMYMYTYNMVVCERIYTSLPTHFLIFYAIRDGKLVPWTYGKVFSFFFPLACKIPKVSGEPNVLTLWATGDLSGC